MSIRLVLGLLGVFIVSQLLPSQSAEQDDAKASQQFCRIVRMTLAARERHRANGDVPENDEFTAAAKACKNLEKTLAEGDSPASNPRAPRHLPFDATGAVGCARKESRRLKGPRPVLRAQFPCQESLQCGRADKAEAYAKQLLSQAPQYRNDWNYGDAIFFGNFVLGRVSLSKGDVKQADPYLLASAKTPGSPQLDSFGPNMTLAKELLDKGESESVLQYLELCRKFWEGEQQGLDEWRQAIRNGKTPDSGANLS